MNFSSQVPETSLNFGLTIQIVDDEEVEPTEAFTVSVQLLTPLNVSNITATVFIQDDDGA